MQDFFASIFSLFLSPLGVIALAALDSSMLFFLPAALDIAVIILAARNNEIFWLYPLLATAGSLAGAYVTFKIGRKIGDASLECWIPERRLKWIQEKVKNKGAIALAIPGLMPPPFPLTPFILACGAFKVSRTRFFLTLALARLLRFSVAAILARIYGSRIIDLINSNGFKIVVGGFIFIAVVGTAVSAYKIIQSTKTYRGRSQASDKAA